MALPQCLLAAALPFPDNSVVAYSSCSPSLASSPSHIAFEVARRLILARNASRSLLDSFLTSIVIGSPSSMYIFSVTTSAHLLSALTELKELKLEGLTGECGQMYDLSPETLVISCRNIVV